VPGLLAEVVNAADEDGYTPLHIAAEQGSHDLVVRMIRCGANSAARTRSGGKTPLHLAAAAGHSDLLPLLTTPTSLDLRDAQGRTPLQLAAKHRQWEAAAVLVAAGASPAAPDLSSSPLGLAIKGLPHSGAAHLASRLLVTMMLDPGSAGLLAEAVTYQNDRQQTVLHWAAYLGHQELVAKLLQAGADRDAADTTGATPYQQQPSRATLTWCHC
jgi:cytohesin